MSKPNKLEAFIKKQREIINQIDSDNADLLDQIELCQAEPGYLERISNRIIHLNELKLISEKAIEELNIDKSKINPVVFGYAKILGAISELINFQTEEIKEKAVEIELKKPDNIEEF